MKSQKKFFSKWLLLYLILTLIFGLYLFEVREPLPALEHRIVEIGLVLAACGLAELWARANSLELIAAPRTYKPHYTWLEEPEESWSPALEKPGVTESQTAFGGSNWDKAGLPVQETFLSLELKAVRAQVLRKN